MDYSVWSQVLLELALSVSGELELEDLTNKVGLAFLRKLNCTYVGIVQIMGIGEPNCFLFSVPKTVLLSQESAEIYDAIQHNRVDDFETFSSGQWFYVMKLKHFGYIVMKRPKAFEKAMVMDLRPILDSFAHNCHGCLETQRRVRAEKALIREKTFLNALVNAIPDLFFYKDENGVYQTVNDALFKRFKKPFLGKTDWEVQPKPLAELFSHYDQRVKNEGIPMLYEYELTNDSGENKYFETFKVPFYSEHGRFSGVIGISRDITERKHKMNFQNLLIDLATHLINTPESLLDQGIEQALKLTSTFMKVDRAYMFLYAFAIEKAILSHEWHAEHIDMGVIPGMQLSLEGLTGDWVTRHKRGEIITIEDLLHLSKDSALFSILNDFTVKSTISLPLMFGEQCLGFIGFDSITANKHWTDSEIALLRVLAEIITNLLVRKSYEQEMIQAKLSAERASESKGEFLANISHEVRTPLHGIMSMLYLLKKTGLSAEQHDYIELADTSATSLLTIVNDILDFSKLESGKLEMESVEFILIKELELAMSLVMPLALSKKIELQLISQGDLSITLKGDAIRIRQNIVNLLSNAIKFTEKGHVHLRAQFNRALSQLNFEVEDTGIGIPEDKKNVIFDRFTQVDGSVSRKYGGTGLGLSIVKKLVTQMGGALYFDSKVGEGSTFYVQVKLEHSPESFREILNEQRLALLYGTDEKFRETLLQFFNSDLQKFKKNIDQALACENSETLKSDIVNLKTAALNMGADRIVQAIERFEVSSDAQDVLSEVQQFIDYLKSDGRG